MEWAFLQVSPHNVLKIRGPLDSKILFHFSLDLYFNKNVNSESIYYCEKKTF